MSAVLLPAAESVATRWTVVNASAVPDIGSAALVALLIQVGTVKTGAAGTDVSLTVAFVASPDRLPLGTFTSTACAVTDPSGRVSTGRVQLQWPVPSTGMPVTGT